MCFELDAYIAENVQKWLLWTSKCFSSIREKDFDI